MIDATTRQTATLPAAEAPPPPADVTADVAANDDTSRACPDCVAFADANPFTAELGGVADADPATKKGDSTTFTAESGNAFRTDGAGNVVPPKHSDVDQGDLGDCWLMAGSAAVAHRDPGYIQNRITKKADGTFDVKLGSETHNVKATFPNAGYADPTPNNQRDTLWPALIEKAAAQDEGGYGELDGGNSGKAMTMLTGKSNVEVPMNGWLTTTDNVYAMMKAGKDGDHPMTFETKASGVAEPLKENHAYAVLDVYERDGEKYAKVYNPWGTNDGARTAASMETEVKIEDLIDNGTKVFINGG